MFSAVIAVFEKNENGDFCIMHTLLSAIIEWNNSEGRTHTEILLRRRAIVSRPSDAREIHV